MVSRAACSSVWQGPCQKIAPSEPTTNAPYPDINCKYHSCHVNREGYFAHLSDQLVADCIQLGLDALLTLSCVLVVNRKVKAQDVVHRSMINQSIIFCKESHHVNIKTFRTYFLYGSYKIDATLSWVLGADPLSPGQGVQRSGFIRPGDAAETVSTVGCVYPAGCSLLQSAGHATAAPRLPQHLLTVWRDGGAVAECLLSAGGTADWLRPHHRGRPDHSHRHHRCHCYYLLI